MSLLRGANRGPGCQICCHAYRNPDRLGDGALKRLRASPAQQPRSQLSQPKKKTPAEGPGSQSGCVRSLGVLHPVSFSPTIYTLARWVQSGTRHRNRSRVRNGTPTPVTFAGDLAQSPARVTRVPSGLSSAGGPSCRRGPAQRVPERLGNSIGVNERRYSGRPQLAADRLLAPRERLGGGYFTSAEL
jgi:hypothetical protein